MAKEFFNQFSVRTSNVLHRMKLTTRDSILRAVKNRTLHPSNIDARGFGKKSLDEVRAWLGLPPILSSQNVHHIRCRIASGLRDDGHDYRTIAFIMRFRSREDARKHVAKGDRLLGKTLRY